MATGYIRSSGKIVGKIGTGVFVPDETDPTVPSWVKAITQEDIDRWNEGLERIEELPEPAEEYRGCLKLVEEDGEDKLYICLKIDEEYIWKNISDGTVSVSTSPILGQAILGTMVLQ